MERIQRYDQAYLKWENFLKIQLNLFGEDKEQMVMTYKKLSALALSIQFPKKSQECLQKVEEIIAKSERESGVEKTEAQIKEALEEKLAFLF